MQHEAQLPLEKADCTTQRPTFNYGEKKISQRWHSSMHAMLTES